MKLVLKSKNNTHYATAEYDGCKIVVLPGSRINMVLTHSAMSKSIKEARQNTNIVSPEGKVLKEISFDSPSAAAQFVTGRSVNGYISWRIDDKISLKEYREQNN